MTKELKIANNKYTHKSELEERLNFIRTYAANSSFELTKKHLKVIYDLLAGSPVKSDLEQMMLWCKSACENITDRVVNLNEIGEFFSE